MGLILLLPATAICVAAYVVLYLSGRSEGGMRAFGRVLGIWTLSIAAALAIAALSSPFFGGRPFGIAPRMEMMRMHPGMREGAMMHGRPGDMMMPGAPPPPAGVQPPPETPPAQTPQQAP